MAKWFAKDEISGLAPELVSMLDFAREMAGIPFLINSGIRTPEQNQKVGGVIDSSHLKGLAVDIACESSGDRHKIISGLVKAQFKRIGIAKDHIHADIDSSRDIFVLWLE